MPAGVSLGQTIADGYAVAAASYRMPVWFSKRSTELHDIGKMAIPDAILERTGR
jgi:response regulator RpfG family c-di-GMP phosphodiesterase